MWALVTGAGKIGRVGAKIALALAQEGCHIYLHHRGGKPESVASAEEVKRWIEEETEGIVSVTLVAGDLSKEEDVAKMFENISPDIVVNNAAIFKNASRSGEGDLLSFMKEEGKTFDENFMANTKSADLITTAAIWKMRNDKKGGTIFFIGDATVSGGGKVYQESLASYVMSKSFVGPLTRHFAVNLGKEGIRFFGVMNGPIDPPPSAPQKTIDAMVQEMNAPASNLKPWIGGEAVGEVVVALAKMSPAVNGEIFHVDAARGEIVPSEHE